MNLKYQYYSGDQDGFVNQFFTIENTSLNSHVDLIIPDCTPGLLYIEDGYFVRKSSENEKTLISGRLYLFGQKLKSVEYHYNQQYFLAYGIKLNPTCLNVLFDVQAKSLCDKFIDITDSLNNINEVVNYLKTRSHNPPWHNERTVPFVLNDIINKINYNHGQIQMLELAESSGLTYKHMQRLFDRHVGMSPKIYARIIRFNHCVKLASHQDVSLTELAYQGGFFDQNHFIKETKHFTGNVPSRIYKLEARKLEEEQCRYLNFRQF